MSEGSDPDRFEELMAPHLDAAYNLARWLTGNTDDAADVVQEACLRALRFLPSFRGQEPRAWLLAIVRNAGYSWLSRNRHGHAPIDDVAGHDALATQAGDASDPQAFVLADSDRALLVAALERLPAEFREVLVLRELEDLPYKQIADVAGIPIGTVMSRLSRARALLRQTLAQLREDAR